MNIVRSRDISHLRKWNPYTGVPGGKVNILGDHSIGHYKQKCLYERVSYSERFLR